MGCWYLGAANQSCTTVCSTHGGYSTETVKAGSSGTDAKCNAILDGLGAPGTSITPSYPYSVAVGCIYDSTLAARYRVASPTTTTSGVRSTALRACACQY
jgi:hypothetical protein